MVEKKLNLDIPESVYKFESLMERVFPKRIFYKLLLRGKGLEFDSYRTYSPDDDSALIDWKASKRANSLLVKQYVEERDIKVMFLIDISDDMIFGSQEKLKCEYSAELIAALGYVITNATSDQIGYIFFNNDISHITPLSNGKKQFETLEHEISDPNMYGGESNFKNFLDKVMEFLDPTLSLIFIISDFIKVDESCRSIFEDLGAMFETIAIMVKDPLDKTFPDINKEVIIEDPISRERMIVNPKIAKKLYEENAIKQENMVKKMLEIANIDCLTLGTEEDFSPKLAMFLKNRVERRD